MAKRDASIPVAAWWYEAVRREQQARGIKQVKLAELVGDSEENVSRCLNGITPSLRLVLAISKVLSIPRPVFLPRTEQEALALHGALALRGIDAELTEMDTALKSTEEKASDRERPHRTVGKSRRGE